MKPVVCSAGRAWSAVTGSQTHRRGFRGSTTSTVPTARSARSAKGRRPPGRVHHRVGARSLAGRARLGIRALDPAEFGFEHAFDPGRDDPEFAAAAAALAQEWRLTGDSDACFKLLARAAKRLNADGRSNRPRTEDVVVFAIHPEIVSRAYVERHLRACVPADTFKRLKRAGYLVGDP